MVTRLFNLIIVLILVLLPTLGLSAQLEAIPDRTTVNLEESFRLQLRVDGSVDGDPDLSVLEKDFEVLGRSESSQLQIINGDMKRSVTWNLTLLARSAGNKTIPALCIDNQCSAPVSIQVLSAGQTNRNSGGGNDLLLEVVAEPKSIPVQSELIVTVRLLTRLNLVQASLTEPKPSGVEAVVEKLGEDRNFETRLNGLLYQGIERKYALFPQQSGQLIIPPIRFDAQVSDGQRGTFDPFNRRTRQMRKRSEEISVEVLPAPDSTGKVWLPARNLQLIDDWQQNRPQMTVGEPVTRTLTLVARGLPAAQLPTLEVALPDGVKSYPDKPAREDQFDVEGIIGIVQQKVALVPTKPGLLRLPEVKIEWWDTSSEGWREAVVPALDVEVLPATGQARVVPAPSAEPAEAPPLVGKEEQPPVVTSVVEPGFWPWLSLALGSGWLVTLFFLFRNRGGRREKQKPQDATDKAVSQKQLRKKLQEAISSGDTSRVRSALLNWGGALCPDEPPQNLEQLAVFCGEPLSQQLEAFSRSLYSSTESVWDKQAFQMAIQQAEREIEMKKDSNKLPPFYPH